MTLQRLLSHVRRAIDDYSMIEENDKIAIGLSGGKDSLALLIAMKHLQRFYPKKFELHAITVSLGFDGFDTTPAEKICNELEVPYTVVKTDIGQVVFEERKEKNPCSLCSKMRKGSLNDELVNLNCNKVALGHNKDDVVQTFFLSLVYEGRINTFSPVTYLDRKNIHSIRPLIYVPEKDIKDFIASNGIQTVKNPCPVDGHTKRETMKQFIYAQNETFKDFDTKVFSAIKSSHIRGWSDI